MALACVSSSVLQAELASANEQFNSRIKLYTNFISKKFIRYIFNKRLTDQYSWESKKKGNISASRQGNLTPVLFRLARQIAVDIKFIIDYSTDGNVVPFHVDYFDTLQLEFFVEQGEVLRRL